MAPETEREQSIKKLGELIEDIQFAMLTTVDEDGKLRSRPMATQRAEFDGELWFFTYEGSDLAAEIELHPQVNVAFSDPHPHDWRPLSGTAVRVDDRAKAKELWNPLLKAWFPDGLDTPGLMLIRVHGESAEYWEAAHSSKVITMLGYAKAAVTGKSPDAGENETVRL